MQMSFNGSGTFVINSTGQPVVTGTVISSTAFNALTADLATGLSTALTKDGQTTPTADLPMGTFKFTGVGNGSAATDSATISQVQSSFGSFLTVAGTDTITASVSPSLTAYASGQMFAFVAANTNTGAVTINISSLGAKAITKNGNTALSAGDLTANYLFVVVYDGTQFQVVGVSATTFTNLTVSGVLTLSGAGTQLNSTGTGAWKLPNGTTAQRPATPVVGMERYNSTLDQFEGYVSTGWQQITSLLYSASYLVVAGGGGGASGYSAGGGAGGLLTGTTALSSGVAYTITVGAGGAGGTTGTPANGVSGGDSVINGVATAIGGGYGGKSENTNGGAGGSGGGGSVLAVGGAGTSGQGNNGGNGYSASNTNYSAGGGGGAGAVGATGTSNTGGSGGAGVSNSLSGSAVNYAGGGGGGTLGGGTSGAGGLGGGGAAGAAGGNNVGVAGTANTGGGGGGASYQSAHVAGGAGGSGIVIISYAGAQRGTGGTVTSSGGNTIHTFTSSGTYTA
jgi:hypothetical protein